jgi:probable HAF family extracellular repeat protein
VRYCWPGRLAACSGSTSPRDGDATSIAGNGPYVAYGQHPHAPRQGRHGQLTQPTKLLIWGRSGEPSATLEASTTPGEIVGASTTAVAPSTRFAGPMGWMTDLGTLGGSYSWAESNDSAGQVVGQSSTSAAIDTPYCGTNGTVVDLGTLGGRSSQATDIQPSGTDRRYQRDSRRGKRTAFLWEEGVMTDLGTLGGSTSQALGINPRGEVVGDAQNALGWSSAFVWSNGVMTDLGPLSAQAQAINPAGDVVGSGMPVGATTNPRSSGGTEP